SRPVSTPAELPRELQEVIDSPLASVRGAAVQELTRLLTGRHAGLALGARLALERLTNDDSRTVAAAAAAALATQASAPPAATTPADGLPAAPPAEDSAASGPGEDLATPGPAEDLATPVPADVPVPAAASAGTPVPAATGVEAET